MGFAQQTIRRMVDFKGGSKTDQRPSGALSQEPAISHSFIRSLISSILPLPSLSVCMYICVYMYMCIHIHTCTYFICVHIYCICTMYIFICVHLLYMYNVYIYICTYIVQYTYIVYVYIFTLKLLNK